MKNSTFSGAVASRYLLHMIMVAALTAISFMAKAQTVTSDKIDYSPGETAIITGNGWMNDLLVDIHFEQDPEIDHSHAYHDITVNPDGTFTVYFPIDTTHIGVTFTVVVEGKQSGATASTFFTDGNINVKANESGITILFFKYTNASNCNGSVSSSGTSSVSTSGNGTTIVDALTSDRVKLIAPEFSPSGGPFISWTRGGTTLSTREICIQGSTSAQNWSLNYGPCIDFTTCPGNLNVNTDPGQCSAIVNYVSTASSSSSVSYSYSFSGATTGSGSGTGSGSTFNKGNTDVIVTATSSCGSTTCSFKIIVVDNEDPVITATGNSLDLGCNPSAEAIDHALGTATATDNCSVGDVSASDGELVVNGCSRSQTRTFTVSDVNGNAATSVTRTATWTVDTENPVISLAAATDPGFNPTAAQIEAAFGAATVTDNCSIELVANGSVGDETGPVDGLWSTTKSWTVTDDCGNTGTASQTVSYSRDNEPPVIELADASAVGCNPTAEEIAAAFGAATVTDNVSVGLEATGTVENEEGSGCNYSTTKTWTATDAAGNVGTASQTVYYTRDTAVPVISATGTTLTLGCNPSATDIDAALSTATATDNCGVGTPTASDGPVTGTCTKSQTRTWNVSDNCGNPATAVSRTVTWTVDTDAPVITISASAYVVQINSQVTVSGSITDNCSVSSSTINWGDGQSSALTLPAVHQYTATGVYTVTVTATDGCGNIAFKELSEFIVVYDPNGGFVTGGGWIDSPEGASSLYPDAKGKANFGFVSKYQKGANVPTGNTEFQFKAGDLNFKSTSYEWLVVAGQKAQFKGTGTVNGSGSYQFLITAIDGVPDKFRIKINGVYDNALGAAEDSDAATILGGGSIVIHNPSKGKTNARTSSVEAEETPLMETIELQAYPNPIKFVVTVRFSNPENAPVAINMLDMAGRNMSIRVTEISTSEYSLDTQELTNGFYYLKVRVGNSVQGLKLLKQE